MNADITELRKDPITGRWAIIYVDGQRDLPKWEPVGADGDTENCPFCEGQFCEEHLSVKTHRCISNPEAWQAWLRNIDTRPKAGLVHFENGVKCFVNPHTDTWITYYCENGKISFNWRKFRFWRQIITWEERKEMVEYPWPRPQFHYGSWNQPLNEPPYVVHGVDNLIKRNIIIVPRES